MGSTKEKLPNPAQVERHIGRAFATMEDDPSVSEFGLFADISEPSPVAVIPRDEFPRLALPEAEEPSDTRRYRDERTQLTVLRAILERSLSRRWQFVWQGIRIAAPIRDPVFFDKLATREYWFAQGDVLDVMLRIHQVRDDISDVFINESYEVLTVYGVRHTERQPRLPGH